ncbi:MAG TPA: signal recognition particle-docking protein FtsY [bacterium]|nr:signal recognition particle-docking protein FtsY [bacterium]
MFKKLREGLRKTTSSIQEKVSNAIGHSIEINEEFYDNLEEALLLSDVGARTSGEIIQRCKDKLAKVKPRDKEHLKSIIRKVMSEMLEESGVEEEMYFDRGVNLIMVIGVNGSGKTTTIGKLASQFKAQGKSVMLAACDTFRAAAVEQLQIWGERNDVPVISQKEGTDPSAVMFDAIQSAKAREIDVLIADTAGRLHTQSNLMRELEKIRRVAVEKAGATSIRTWLVLDSTVGQNALSQVKLFNDIVPVDALILTKMDGTARGGIVFSIVYEWKMPIMYIGVGEQVDDLLRFDPLEFAKALLGDQLDVDEPEE